MNAKKALFVTAALSGLTMGVTMADNQQKGQATPKAESKVVEGQCHGVNTCKGKSACHTADSACAGQNSCKGKGWIKTTKEDCEKQKGEFKES